MIEIRIDGELYTEKQFRKDLVRMFNSCRSPRICVNTIHELCADVRCKDCPLNNCCPLFHTAWKGTSWEEYYTFKAVEIVHKWAKEHPVRTNRDKLKEVFGEGVLYMFLKSNYRYGDDIKRFEFDTKFEEWLNEEYKEYEKDD